MTDFLALAAAACGGARASRAVANRGGRSLPYTDFVASVLGWKRAWSGLAGQRVGLYFDDPFSFVCALYGAWHAGKQVWLPGDTLSATVERLMQRVDACAGELPGAISPASAHRHEDSLRPLSPDTSLVVFTSGSTGEPAAIAKRLAQLDAEVRSLEAVFGAALGDATFHSTVSHQHIYGLLFQVLWPLAAGRPFCCERLRYPEQIAGLPPVPASVLVSSPAHLRRLGGVRDWRTAREGLRSVFSSGGPLPPEVAEQVALLLGHSPTEVYGSSETGGIAWRRRSVHTAVWQALPGVEWRIDDGQLHVRSPHLPDMAWTATHDNAAPAGQGGFVLLGRSDRVAKVEEKRISLSAIERLLNALPEIDEARAFVLPAPTGDRVAVVAVPTALGWAAQAEEGQRSINGRLRAALAGALEPVGLPRRFRLVRAIPVNSQGKVTDALLAALFRPLLPPVSWLQREAEQARARLEVTADLAVFDGHFADMPVLPGVAQIDWAVTFAQQCFDLPGRFLRAEQIKFLRPVCPPLEMTLDLSWDATAGCLRFQLGSIEGAHASGRLFWACADHG